MEYFNRQIIEWYETNKRNLPWRSTRDPYKIWLSEIILQQTRVQQGLSYYLKFIDKYPDVYALAEAPIDEVLKLWQGLGYYSRANNLHKAAKLIVSNYDGKFPEQTKDLMNIIGIGSYTAAAIASLAFNVAAVVVDGNVFRVLARIFGIHTPINTSLGKKEFSLLGNQLMDKQQPGNFNQAMMEFGALCCTPKNPQCHHCIFSEKCYAKANNLVGVLPIKNPKAKVRLRYFYYFLLEDGDGEQASFYINKRTKKDIWRNLYDLPLVEFDQEVEPLFAMQDSGIQKYLENSPHSISSISKVYKHKLTHQQIMTVFIHIKLAKNLVSKAENYLLLVNQHELVNYPVPRLIEQYFQDRKLMAG